MNLKPSIRYNPDRESDFAYTLLLSFSLIMILFSFSVASPMEIWKGMGILIVEPDRLITDYIKVAGMGAAFFNSGILMGLSVIGLRLLKLPFSGMSISCCFLMGGFSLFGKNPINIIPLLLGTLLYALYKRERIGKYIYVGLFGTTLSPIITELHIMAEAWDGNLGKVFPIAAGIAIGFVLPSLATYTLRVHQGYNLYNVGFAAGLLGVVLASMLKSMGNTYESRFIWSEGNNVLLGSFLSLVFLSLILIGWTCSSKGLKDFFRITRHSGRSIADFVVLDGLPVTLVNMGVLGFFGMGVVLVCGGELNGPTIGGVLSIVGFGSFGKHFKNVIWPILGVVIAAQFSVFSTDEPYVILAMLFSTGLAPIAGQFGFHWGIIAGMMHSWVVLNVGAVNGGLNLYNNGFSAGLVCLVLVPIIQSLRKDD